MKQFASALRALTLCILVFAPTAAWSQSPAVEREKVILGAGGGVYTLIRDLPIVVAHSLGYFKDEGIEVQFVDFKSGAQGLQALVAGNVEFAAGTYDHTIQMQAKGTSLVNVLSMNRYASYVLAVVKSKSKGIKSVKDLKGKAIGISGPGSGSHVFGVRALEKVGLHTSDVSWVGVGSGATAIAAVQRGEIDAIVAEDPAISELTTRDNVTVLIDSRAKDGTAYIYGGDIAAIGIYSTTEYVNKHPKTTQALVNAVVRAMLYMQRNPIEAVIERVPEQYRKDAAEYKLMLQRNIAAMAFDGRVTPEMAKNSLEGISTLQPDLKKANIDLAKTYTNRFVDVAHAKYK